jgi:hypothetical protein
MLLCLSDVPCLEIYRNIWISVGYALVVVEGKKGTKGMNPSVYVLLYMLGGMWLDFAAVHAALSAAVCTAD